MPIVRIKAIRLNPSHFADYDDDRRLVMGFSAQPSAILYKLGPIRKVLDQGPLHNRFISIIWLTFRLATYVLEDR